MFVIDPYWFVPIFAYLVFHVSYMCVYMLFNYHTDLYINTADTIHFVMSCHEVLR